MHRDAETGEKVISQYEKRCHRDYEYMPQEMRDKIAVCVKMGNLHGAIEIYGFDQVAMVYLCHPSLRGR